MTTPKVATIKRGDSRFYVSPENGAKVPGVTSIVNMTPKTHLQFWAAKEVATAAVDELGTVVQMTLRDRQAAIDHLKAAPRRITNKAADIGSDAHDIFERMAKGENIGRVHPDLEEYKRHFGEFLDRKQPEYLFMEETVWSDAHDYAGSFDALARIDGEVVWIDNKTTRSGVHEDVALQLSAYRYADAIIRPDGSRVPIPKAQGAAVLHIRPEGWKLVPVRADEDIYGYFLHLREVFRWEKEVKPTVIGQPLAIGGGDQTGPALNKPRARKAA